MIWLEGSVLGTLVAVIGLMSHYSIRDLECPKMPKLTRLPITSGSTARGKKTAAFMTVLGGIVVAFVDAFSEEKKKPTPAEQRRTEFVRLMSTFEPPPLPPAPVIEDKREVQYIEPIRNERRLVAAAADGSETYRTVSPCGKMVLRDNRIQAINRGLRELNDIQLGEIVDAIKYKLDREPQSDFDQLRSAFGTLDKAAKNAVV